MAKVTVFAMENPEAAVRLMWRQEPQTRPVPAEEERVLRRDMEILRQRLASFRIDPDDPDQRWGAIDRREIVAWQEFLLASGAITRRLEPELFYTSEFMDAFNDFDQRTVQDQARAWAQRSP
jgi:NitT/TauT family transport system substrate-binding protein